MRLPHIVTALFVVLSATAAHGQSAHRGFRVLRFASGVRRVVAAARVGPAAARLQIVRPARIRRACPPAPGSRSARQRRNVSRPGQKQRVRDTERQRTVHRRDAGRRRRPLECSCSGQPGRRRRLRRRRDHACRRACVHRRDASLCHRVLRWWTDDVVARVPARLAHRGHRAGLRASISRPVQRPSSSGADLSRVGRPTEPLRWPRGRAEARSGWRAFPKLSPAGRATTRARGTSVLDDPPGPLSTMRYDGCGDGTEVRMIRIDGLGHTWTKKEVDTTGVMWQFFKSHRLSR